MPLAFVLVPALVPALSAEVEGGEKSRDERSDSEAPARGVVFFLFFLILKAIFYFGPY